jgi:hypothetical protein
VNRHLDCGDVKQRDTDQLAVSGVMAREQLQFDHVARVQPSCVWKFLMGI